MTKSVRRDSKSLKEVKRPLLSLPVLQSKIWGGSQLQTMLGKKGGERIGESWELSDNDTAQSKIQLLNGELSSFRNFYQTYRKEILGIHYAHHSGPFPLLIKYIDAQQNLSVQVHPGDNSRSGEAKTEAWYVVDAPPNASLIVGLNSRQSRDKILAQLQTSDAIKVLNKIPVKNGDVLFIPAGTVHSITKGLLIYEIQQNSDTTFRLYDWDRITSSGKPRTLHLSRAAECIDYSMNGEYKIDPLAVSFPACNVSYLVACRHFIMERWYNFKTDVQVPLKNNFIIFSCLQGRATITANKFSVNCKLGDTILVPAVCNEVNITPVTKNLNLLSSQIPKNKESAIQPLISAGFPQSSIRQLWGKREF